MSLVMDMHQAHQARHERLWRPKVRLSPVSPITRVIRLRHPVVIEPEVHAPLPRYRPSRSRRIEVAPGGATACSLVTAPGWRSLLAIVAMKHSIRPDDILSVHRFRQLVAARKEAAFLIYIHTALCWQQLAIRLQRDRSTIQHDVKSFARGNVARELALAAARKAKAQGQ
jgi:hypothetical protein